jgi:hypothetical protein
VATDQVTAATSETLAHLEMLRLEGRALLRDGEGMDRYTLK